MLRVQKEDQQTRRLAAQELSAAGLQWNEGLLMAHRFHLGRYRNYRR